MMPLEQRQSEMKGRVLPQKLAIAEMMFKSMGIVEDRARLLGALASYRSLEREYFRSQHIREFRKSMKKFWSQWYSIAHTYQTNTAVNFPFPKDATLIGPEPLTPWEVRKDHPIK